MFHSIVVSVVALPHAVEAKSGWDGIARPDAQRSPQGRTRPFLLPVPLD